MLLETKLYVCLDNYVLTDLVFFRMLGMKINVRVLFTEYSARANSLKAIL
jgi:hypothetical protein